MLEFEWVHEEVGGPVVEVGVLFGRRAQSWVQRGEGLGPEALGGRLIEFRDESDR